MDDRELRLECLRLGGGPNHAEKAYAWVTGQPHPPVVQRVFVEGLHCAECDGTGVTPKSKDDPLGQLPCDCNGTGLAPKELTLTHEDKVEALSQ